MGTITVDDANVSKEYGVLGTRFNTLRELYNCVRAQVNEHKSPKECVK
jgi:hypothetical protein